MQFHDNQGFKLRHRILIRIAIKVSLMRHFELAEHLGSETS